MDADDDLVMVIIGDGENEEFPAPMNIKKEVLDEEDVEKIIETAALHGEFVDIESLKEEPPDISEYENENDDWGEGNDVWIGDNDDEDYVPQEDEEDDDDEDCDNADDSDYAEDSREYEPATKSRHRMVKPAHQKSFVKELREQYPELEDDTNALVTTLSEIMRNVKPPPPPQDYFIMNGIMFECVICGSISESMPAAGRHYQEKHGERYLVCFACGVDFRSTTNLYKHEKRCLAPDAVVVLKARAWALGRKGRARPFIPKHFPEVPKAKKPHERKHACSMCPARFVSKTYLRSHEMLHRGERPHACETCPAAYTSLAALSRHLLQHTDDQYICDHCGRAFKIKAALITHMNTHLAVKKFGCEQCPKRYATKAALVRHVDGVHLNLPPPCVCKICFKRYPRMSILKDHTKKAHGLILMTRRMFFKSLPTLTEMQIEQAKVVLKSELEPDGYPESPLQYQEPEPDSDSETEFLPEPYQTVDVTVKEEPEELYVAEEQAVAEIEAEAGAEAEQRIILSEEVVQYMQAMQAMREADEGDTYNLMLVDESGQPMDLQCDGHELLSGLQIVVQEE